MRAYSAANSPLEVRYDFEPDPDCVLDLREQLTFKLAAFRLTFTRRVGVDTMVHAKNFRLSDATPQGRSRRGGSRRAARRWRRDPSRRTGGPGTVGQGIAVPGVVR